MNNNLIQQPHVVIPCPATLSLLHFALREGILRLNAQRQPIQGYSAKMAGGEMHMVPPPSPGVDSRNIRATAVLIPVDQWMPIYWEIDSIGGVDAESKMSPPLVQPGGTPDPVEVRLYVPTHEYAGKMIVI